MTLGLIAGVLVDPEGDLELSIIQGQEESELLGRRIHDTAANPYPVPTCAWKASGAFSRAWAIQMQRRKPNGRSHLHRRSDV